MPRRSVAGSAAPLTRAQLNRATLARQMLLGREKVSPMLAIERLAGLQAQLARPPYIGLWSRLEGFRREDLGAALSRREVVRATMMRGTLHLVSAKDYIRLRPVLQPMLTRSLQAVLKQRAAALEMEPLLAAARAYLAKEPRTFDEVRDHLESLKLPGDERARGFAVRMRLPLIQVPTDAPWGYPGAADFTLAEAWLGEAFQAYGEKAESPEPLVLFYLAAFGPATVADAQTWSGLQGLRGAFEALRPKLVTFRDERGRELFDLPDAPRPPEDVPAPARFLPEFDNLVMAHADRSRLIADEHRPLIFRANLRVLPTFLVDGVVAGTWDIERSNGRAALVMEPFGKLSKKAFAALEEEAERLVRFVEPDAKEHGVRVGQK